MFAVTYSTITEIDAQTICEKNPESLGKNIERHFETCQ